MEIQPIYLFEGAVLITLSFILYRLCHPFDFWKQLGLPHISHQVPILGNLDSVLLSVQEMSEKLYKAFPNVRFYGTFTLWRPTLIVKDPVVIDQMLIKDFGYLYNRNYYMDRDTSALSKHLGNHVDRDWKKLRNRLSACLATGKLKFMQPQMVNCAKEFVDYLSRFEDGDEIEMKDLCGRYAVDVIASCGFGLDLHVMNNPNSQFYRIGKEMFDANYVTKLCFMLQPFLRGFYRLIRVGMISKNMTKFFLGSLHENLAYRDKNNVIRPDILNHLVELEKRDESLPSIDKISKESANQPFDRTSLNANAFMFFAAAYDSSGSTLSNLFYELALNEGVQDKLHGEIIRVLRSHGGDVTFEAVRQMSYLDHVLSETLRLHPPGVAVDRVVTKEYTIPGTDILLPVGTMVYVPIYGMHRDPNYFPEPEAFKPERFDTNLNEIVKGAYLPFGAGPRLCIAARFAKLEIKVCAAMVLQHYEIHTCSNTKIPMEYDHRSFMLVSKNGIRLSLKRRGSTR